jgi:hypothetical protein
MRSWQICTAESIKGRIERSLPGEPTFRKPMDGAAMPKGRYRETRKTGRFTVKRQTIRKRLPGKLGELKEELLRRWHQPVAEVGKWLRSVVQGYFNYQDEESFRGKFEMTKDGAWHLDRRLSEALDVAQRNSPDWLAGSLVINEEYSYKHGERCLSGDCRFFDCRFLQEAATENSNTS